jgi:hypothetical protein
MILFKDDRPKVGYSVVVYTKKGNIDVVVCEKERIAGFFKDKYHETNQVYWSCCRRGVVYDESDLKGWNRMPQEDDILHGGGQKNYNSDLVVMKRVTKDNNANINIIWFFEKHCLDENNNIIPKSKTAHDVRIGLRDNEYDALKEHFRRQIMKEMGFVEFDEHFSGNGIIDLTQPLRKPEEFENARKICINCGDNNE